MASFIALNSDGTTLFLSQSLLDCNGANIFVSPLVLDCDGNELAVLITKERSATRPREGTIENVSIKGRFI